MANNLIQKATAQAAVKQESGKTTMQAYIRQMEGEIRKALPAVMTPERFTRIILSALIMFIGIGTLIIAKHPALHYHSSS